MLISPEEYKMTNWIDEDFHLRKNPIQEEAEKWFEKIKPNTIRHFQDRCDTCGEMKWNGVSNMMDGTFRCNDCLIKWKVEQLCNDPFWVKQDRVFQLRQARKKHEIDSEAKRSVEAAIKREQEAAI
jgi:hypothetical protein